MSISDTQFNDDQYNYDPTEQVQRGPQPGILMPGVYKVEGQILNRKNSESGDDVVSTDQQGNQWPVLVIPGIEVVEGDSGRFDVWHEIRTRPNRFGEDQPWVSEGAVLLNAIDAEEAQSATTFGEAVNKLKTKVGSGNVTFAVSTGLTARDSDWAYAEIKRLNLDNTNPEHKREIQKIWKKANLPTKTFMVRKGTKDTPAVYSTTAKSPLSGKLLRAKTKISRFLPSNLEGVEFGTGKFPPRD
jgi:hypothetical protein